MDGDYYLGFAYTRTPLKNEHKFIINSMTRSCLVMSELTSISKSVRFIIIREFRKYVSDFFSPLFLRRFQFFRSNFLQTMPIGLFDDGDIVENQGEYDILEQ